MEYLTVTWDELIVRMIILTSSVLLRSSKKPDIIVAIARGGLTIAHILSDMLELPVASFTVSSYKNLQRTDDFQMTFKVGGKLNGRHVLLVDDVSDSGRTFIRAVKYLKKCGASQVSTAALFLKPQTVFRPDHYVEKTDAWIIFPWDMCETLEVISAKMKADGLPEHTIRSELERLGIPRNYITFFRTSIFACDESDTVNKV